MRGFNNCCLIMVVLVSVLHIIDLYDDHLCFYGIATLLIGLCGLIGVGIEYLIHLADRKDQAVRIVYVESSNNFKSFVDKQKQDDQ